MKTFTRDYNIKEYRDETFDGYFGGLKGCVFDIETTGLSAKNGRGKVILTAMLVPTEKGVRVTQFLAEDPFEEDRVISSTMQFLAAEGIDYLITFNGTSFDVPFMRERIEFLHLPYELNMYNLDLYSFLRKYSVLPNQMESMKQKNIEDYFGFGNKRQDVIDGGQSVKLFFEYVTTHDSVIEKIILTHNREDVVQLYRILLAAGYDGFRGVLACGSFDEAIARFGIPVGECADLTAKPQISRTRLKIKGRQRRAPKMIGSLQNNTSHDRPVRVYYDDSICDFPISARLFPENDYDMSVEFAGATHSFELNIPLMRHGESSYISLPELGCTEALMNKYRIGELPGYVNGYVILIEESQINQAEINAVTHVLCEIAKGRISAL